MVNTLLRGARHSLYFESSGVLFDCTTGRTLHWHTQQKYPIIDSWNRESIPIITVAHRAIEIYHARNMMQCNESNQCLVADFLFYLHAFCQIKSNDNFQQHRIVHRGLITLDWYFWVVFLMPPLKGIFGSILAPTFLNQHQVFAKCIVNVLSPSLFFVITFCSHVTITMASK